MNPSSDRDAFPQTRGGGDPVRSALLFGVLLVAATTAGCAPAPLRITALERSIAEAAWPILTMDPEAVWSDCYNRLVELAPASMAYLAEHPTLAHPAAPDDLHVMLHTSLLRLLIYPPHRPRLSANCLETSSNVLHFDLKVDGRRLGTVVVPAGVHPASWLDLYPADFDHARAAGIDVEADRLAMRAWWRDCRDRPHSLPAAGPLRPRPRDLWRLLARRYADRWSYQPRTRTLRCGLGPAEPALIQLATRDYNLVWAACVWLGSSGQPAIRDRLIELVASPSPIVAHNALFALQFAPDPRIRELLERYIDTEGTLPAGEPTRMDCPPTITRAAAGAECSDS